MQVSFFYKLLDSLFGRIDINQKYKSEVLALNFATKRAICITKG